MAIRPLHRQGGRERSWWVPPTDRYDLSEPVGWLERMVGFFIRSCACSGGRVNAHSTSFSGGCGALLRLSAWHSKNETMGYCAGVCRRIRYRLGDYTPIARSRMDMAIGCVPRPTRHVWRDAIGACDGIIRRSVFDVRCLGTSSTTPIGRVFVRANPPFERGFG